MDASTRAFLTRLLETASPSGFETAAASVWRAEAERFADEVTTDSNGNSFARLKGNGPRVMIEGHIDEIGVMITHIDDDGYLWFSGIGGWDDQVLVGQRIRVLGTHETVVGVVGKKPIHQMEPDERSKVSKMRSLWIDIGATDADDARKKVEIGDPGVIEQPVIELGNDCIASRGADNRVGAFVALEELRKLAAGERPAADVWAVAAVQEEVGLHGGRTSAYSLEPDVAIAIDVTHATDHPDADVRGVGKCRIGGGPAFGRGNAIHPNVYAQLVAAAGAADIPYSIEALPARSGTDADSITRERGGIPTGLVSIPNRYMHSPSEVVSLVDLDNCAAVIAEFVRRLDPAADFRRS
ncbi:MAG: M42 family metallopeptidase [Chloroflexota bacterium]